MQTIEEVRKHCRDVGQDIEKAVAAGMDLGEYFGGQGPLFRFKVEKERC